MSVSRRHPVTGRRLGGLALAFLSLMVVGAGLAWACTPQARVFINSPGEARAAAGDTVTVRGIKYPEGDTVRIRWNGPQGRLLGTAQLGERDDFTTTVRIPADVAPGSYVIYAIPSAGTRRFEGNEDAGWASIAVEPRRRGAPTGPGTPTGPRNPTGPGNPTRPGTPTGPRRPSTSPSARGIPGSVGRGEPSRPDLGGTGSSPGARDISSGRGSDGSAVSRPEGRSAGGAGAVPEVFPGSEAPKSSGTTGSASGTAWGDRQPSGAQSPWKRPRAGKAPSLTDGEAEAGSNSPLSARLAIGAGLLGIGLVALFAGFAAAEVRRRRLATQPGRRTP